jgi:hypothetical protein
VPGPDEHATALERAHRSLAVLAELKPAESRALLLQAAGRTYSEIESATGWTHTKVNRALTEGRAAFRARLAALDAGAECERLAPALAAFANGTAPLDRRITLRAPARVRELPSAPARAARSGGVMRRPGGCPRRVRSAVVDAEGHVDRRSVGTVGCVRRPCSERCSLVARTCGEHEVERLDGHGGGFGQSAGAALEQHRVADPEHPLGGEDRRVGARAGAIADDLVRLRRGGVPGPQPHHFASARSEASPFNTGTWLLTAPASPARSPKITVKKAPPSICSPLTRN